MFEVNIMATFCTQLYVEVTKRGLKHWEAELAADVGRIAPTDIMLRRGDRVSKQKKRMSTSGFSAALS